MKFLNNKQYNNQDKTKVAAVQMTSTADVDHNLKVAQQLIAEAVRQDAQLVMLPENFAAMGITDAQKLAIAEDVGQGPLQSFLASEAKTHGIWLIGGAIPICSPVSGRLFNTCFVYAPDGSCAARYHKMHLFRFTDQDAAYDETRCFEAGKQVTMVETPFARVGLSVCYDIRFPELYRAMSSPDLIVIPAAFTQTTGLAHWEVLLRARAIENQCYVLAAAQSGMHPDGRRTFGHSMLIDPWGQIVSSFKKGNGVLVAEMSRARIQSVRQMLPALNNRRESCLFSS